MIDIDGLLRTVDLAALVESYDVKLKRDGKEFKGCCPFHQERTPSFYVSPIKQFVHCFGCGAHYNAIGFVMAMTHASFIDACRSLGAGEIRPVTVVRVQQQGEEIEEIWVPVQPVPEEAPIFVAGEWGALWNPKKSKSWKVKPERADEYRNERGQLIGYVLRVMFSDGTKATPQVTWCIGPDGSMKWCTVPFPKPRPLCGLDGLAARMDAPVLVVEGEKCRARGAAALPMYVVIAWPGGSKGLRHVDWSPLQDRDIVLFPDADQPGREAMLGYEKSSGLIVRGVAQYARLVGCKSIRMVDPVGQPKGWDLADALDEGWTVRQLGTWAAQRVVDVEVSVDQYRRAD